ncbi:MAG: hypothetical protein ABR905_10445 [Terracidiphilus sp.]|jgi:hypothetical protein
MREKLAGRLKLERTGMGIRIEIPSQAGWLAVFFGFWLAFWSATGWFFAAMASTTKSPEAVPWSFAVAWALGWIVILSALILCLAGRTTLTLDESEMEIRRRILRMEWGSRRFATKDVLNLRYIPSLSLRGWEGTTYTTYTSASQIRFEADGKTRRFALGISDIEAFALIDRMLEVYQFPRDRALEYIGRP